MEYILLYLTAVNIIGFFLMAIDKYKSQHNQWRIKEKTLFLIAFIGGAIGVKLGMEIFNHKTRHKTFTIGIPLLIFANITIFSILLCYLAF